MSDAPHTLTPDLLRGGLLRVVLEGEAPARLSPLGEADRAQAVADLADANVFGLPGRRGPYVLHLSVQEGRLVFDVRDAADAPLQTIVLALGPFRGLLKDYQLLVDSHMLAVQEGREARMEAIDMGRRALHNEGAALLGERLAGKIEIDTETARRIFTLVCVMHGRA